MDRQHPHERHTSAVVMMPNSFESHLRIPVLQLEEGREILMDKSKGIFKKMVNQLNHPNVIRRRGVFGTVRFVSKWFLNSVTSI
jgi:hypothetical protein